MRKLGILLALTAACGGATEPTIGHEFQLAFGESVTVPEAAVWLHFTDVVADSRCPLQAQCVWAGDAAIALEIAPTWQGGDSRTDTLHTNLDPQAAALDGYELRLVRVDPYPVMPGTLPPASYRVTLRVDPAVP